MEKESIEQFNHTQFVKNVKKSREDESRYDEESHGQTRFFENLTKDSESEDSSDDSRWDSSGDDNAKPADAFLEVEKEEEVSLGETGVESSEPPAEEETSPKVETESPLPQIEIPPNTIV